MINTKEVEIDRSKVNIENDEEWLWLAEYFVQFLNSPVWTIPIETFMEEHCITFEDKEENAFEHYTIHKEFIKMCDELLEERMNEIGIAKEQFGKAVVVGLAIPDYQEFFEMLFVIDDFELFKKTMVQKNIQLNNEAMNALAKEGVEFTEEEYAEQNLTAEKNELECAIAMSRAHEQEIQKLQTEEERMFMEAIRLSQQTYEAEQAKLAKENKPAPPAPVAKIPTPMVIAAPPAQQEVVEQQAVIPPPVKQMAPPVSSPDKPSNIDHPLLKKLEQDRQISTQMRKEMPQSVLKRPAGSTGLGGLGALPSLNTKGGLGFKKLPKLGDLEKKREEITDKLEKQRLSMDPKALEERKARLKAQREKLLEAKRKEREAQLMKYELLEANLGGNTSNLDGKTMQKRKDIYAMLRR